MAEHESTRKQTIFDRTGKNYEQKKSKTGDKKTDEIRGNPYYARFLTAIVNLGIKNIFHVRAPCFFPFETQADD